MEQRIRHAVHQNVAPLKNVVEADETFIGGYGDLGKETMVLGVIERGGSVVLQVSADRKKRTLHEFILKHVDPEYAAIFTDDWPGCNDLPKHETMTHSKNEYVKAGQIHTNTIEGYWSLVKKAVRGTYHHISPKHLHLYMKGFAWRYNNKDKNLVDRTWLRLLGSAHVRYRELVDQKPTLYNGWARTGETMVKLLDSIGKWVGYPGAPACPRFPITAEPWSKERIKGETL